MPRNPGFTTKNNPWKHKNEEIAKLKEKIKTLQDEKILGPWIRENFLEKLGTLLAYKDMKEWPNEAKIAFDWAKRDAPALAEIYIERNKLATLKVPKNNL